MGRAQREPEPEEHDEGRRRTAGVGETTGEMRVKEKERKKRLESVMIFYEEKKNVQMCLFSVSSSSFIHYWAPKQ